MPRILQRRCCLVHFSLLRIGRYVFTGYIVIYVSMKLKEWAVHDGLVYHPLFDFLLFQSLSGVQSGVNNCFHGVSVV